MEDDDVLAQFTAITSATPERASQYLRLTENNLEQAIQLYFESGGVDMGAPMPSETQQPSQPPLPTGPSGPEVVQIESDDDEPVVTAAAEPRTQVGAGASVEDDEAMARRLQEEMYGGGDREAGSGSPGPEGGVRAPIGRTTETLLGPDWRANPDEMNAAVAEQLRQRRTANRPGIFNQQEPSSSSSIWENESEDPEARRRNLSRATGGASEASSKSSMLAEMFRPPFELMSNLRSWEAVRAEGKEHEKWILVNVQDPNVFDCQVLNRDIWKDSQIQETVRENFVFKQYNKDDPLGMNYIRFYFQAHDSQDAYPHIAIIDPRTGEQVKVWSGTPAPKQMEFLMQLHEFLDRYSLKANSKNPVATRKPERRKEMDVGKMSEDEMMELAMQNSLEARPGPKDSDPDVLTRHGGPSGSLPQTGIESLHSDADGAANGSGVNAVDTSPFAQISSTSPHEEPPPDQPNTTRIQFRHPGGRVIRRFSAHDPVRRIFEWMKAEPLDGKQGVEFELIFMGKNLMQVLDSTIEEAGLKNGSIMVEFIED